jgi:HSP20 family protein
MLKGYYSFFPHQTWTPSVNLYETEDAYMVCVDLAGVDKEKIDIEVVQQRLTVKGTREVPSVKTMESAKDCHRPRLHLMEIDHGPFAREVELPQNVEHEKINAKYADGMLWIEMPKKKQ